MASQEGWAIWVRYFRQACPNPNCLNPHVTVGRNSVGIDSGPSGYRADIGWVCTINPSLFAVDLKLHVTYRLAL